MADITTNGEQIGSVISMTGSAWAVSGDTQRPLTEGAPVYEGEEIVTESDSNVEIRLADDTILGQGEDSAIRLDDYVYEEGDGSLDFSMIKGVLRVVSGEIVKSNPEGFNLSTPMATIGIRGTEVMVQIDNGREIIGVDQMGEGHHVVIANAFGEVIIDKPGMFSGIDFDGSLIAPDEMPDNFISTVVRAAPLTILGDSPRTPGESQEVTPPQFYETIDNQTGEVAPGEGMEVAEEEGEEDDDEDFEMSEEEIEALLELETAGGTEEFGAPADALDPVLETDYDEFENDPQGAQGDPELTGGEGEGEDDDTGDEGDAPPPEDDPEDEPEPPAEDVVAEQDEAQENAPVVVEVLPEDGDTNLVDAVFDENSTGEGEIEINEPQDGSITYTPAEGEDGTVVIDYTIEDPEGETSTAHVSIELVEDSEPVITVTDATGDVVEDVVTATGTITTDFGGDVEGSTIELTADGADWDSEANTLTYSELDENEDSVDIWSIALDDSGEYEFTQHQALPDSVDAAPGEELTIDVTATATDSDGDIASGDFTVTITDEGPLVTDAELTPAENVEEVSYNVFDGEEATAGTFEGEVTTATIGGEPSQQVSIGEDGNTITYTPTAGEEGTVVIDYTVEDSLGDTSSAQLTIELADDSEPVVTVTSGDPVTENTEASTSGTISADFGGDTMESVTLTHDDATWTDATETTLGTLAANDGSWNITLDGNDYTFTQTEAFDHTDGDTANISVGVVATDSDESTSTDSFINVTVVDGAPTAAFVSTDQAAEGETPISYNVISAPGTDLGVDGGTLTAATMDAASDGTGAIGRDANGDITYTPVAGESGTVVINYTVTDSDGDVASNQLTIELADDSAPVVTVSDGTGEESEGVVTASGTISVNFGADSAGSSIELAAEGATWDGDTNTLTYSELDENRESVDIWSIVLAGGAYEFTQHAALAGADASAAGEELIIDVSAMATDGDGTVNSGAFTVTVTDDGPTATDALLTQEIENAGVSYNVISGGEATTGLYTGGALIAADLTAGSGDVEYGSDGNITYSPADGETGTVVIDYMVEDSDGDTASAQLTIELADDSEPVITTSLESEIDDDGLTIASGELSVDFGEDVSGSSIELAAEGANWDAESNTLSYTELDDEGETVEVWNLEITDDGEYEFTQNTSYTGATPNVDVTITATDGDGDVTEAQLGFELTTPEPDQGDPSVNLLVNGDFNTVDVGNFNGGWKAVDADNVDGWKAGKFYDSDGEQSRNYPATGDDAKIEVWHAGFKGVRDPDAVKAEGGGWGTSGKDGYFVEIDYAGATDFISQEVETEAGTDYVLTYYATVRHDAGVRGEVDEDLIVQVDGNDLLASSVDSPETYHPGHNTGWTEYTIKFTADSDKTTVTFSEPASGEDGNAKSTYGVLLDNVSLTVDPDYDGGEDSGAEHELVEEYQIIAGGGDDVLFGDEVDETIEGGAGDDVIFGGEGDDTLSGGIGNDELTGGEGDDLLSGGMGDDTLDGGAGNDTFVFTSPYDGTDTILGFETAMDEITLYEWGVDLNNDGADDSLIYSGPLDFSESSESNLYTSAGDEDNTVELYFDDGENDVLIATIEVDNDDDLVEDIVDTV